MKVIHMTWNYVGDTFSAAIIKIMNYKNEEEGLNEKATQADTRVDLRTLPRYEAESTELQNKVFQLDLYIEELEQTVQQTRQQRDMALADCQLASGHGEGLMQRSLKYRVCRYGKRSHFHQQCPQFSRAEKLSFCTICLSGEGVSESMRTPPAQG